MQHGFIAAGIFLGTPSAMGRCAAALATAVALAVGGGAWAAGRTVPAHYVKLEGTSLESTAKAAYESALRTCQAMQAAGASVQPAAIPAGGTYTAVTVETYYAAQLAVTTRTQRVHGVQPGTCGLRTRVSTSVHVQSPAGTCQIDMKRRRAVGACDVARYLDARPVSAGPGTPTAAEARRVIAGVECELSSETVAGGAKRTACLSRAGRFVAPAAHPHVRTPGLLLQLSAQPELELIATEVRLDTQVEADLLAPHLAPGFGADVRRTAP